MQGLHLTADLYDCAGDAALLTDADRLAERCRALTLASGLTLVNEKWHRFPDWNGQPGGVTGMILLAESHLAIHTWPERGGVTLDVYVCNFTADNSHKAIALMQGLEDAFAPRRVQRERLLRGQADGPTATGELILEHLTPQAAYGFRFPERILSQRTRYQHLELLRSNELGLTLRLDGQYMTSEADEFFYHEAMAHPAAITHEAPRRALIIGGGDGGLAEELLKHPTIERIVLAELDDEVVAVARRHLGSIHRGALDDPRVQVHVGDGAAFVAQTAERFDLVFLDLTDPETPAGPLYTEAFFRQVQQVLAPGGAVVLHLGAPFFEKDQVRELSARLARVFPCLRAYGLYVPLYGAYWALAVASDTLDPKGLDAATVEQRLRARGIANLQYYNAEIHGALFALPNFYRALLP
jgi:spermidine synthase